MSGGGALILAAAGALALTPGLALAQAFGGASSAAPSAFPINDQALSDVLFAARSTGAVSLGQVSVSPFFAAGPSAGPVGATPTLPLGGTANTVNYSVGGPSVWLLRAGPYGINLFPHAGLGLSSAGTNAEAGATFKVASLDGAIADRLSALGVKSGAAFDEKGRWYLFAAVGGRAVGFNMQQDPGGALRRAGWSTDPASALIGDGQLGVGWRKGDMQASLGYVHRQVKFQTGVDGTTQGWTDSMAALSVTFRPH
jgi:hypothetical protein